VLGARSTAEGVANLEIAGACARPDERIGAQIALDVGRDDFTGNALAGHEPLVTPRHGEQKLKSDEAEERKDDTDVSVERGQATRASMRQGGALGSR
jgi:hypothetical protein